MARFHRFASLAIASAFAFTLILNASAAHADLVDDLLGQSKGSVPATLTAKVQAEASGASTATAPTGGATGPAIVPAATPIVVDSYVTDPVQLQAGSRFTLSLTLKNPGGDDAQDVVVKIGPSAENGWGSDNELVVLGGGSARYVGAIAPGTTNGNASFQLMANPSVAGGVRSVPVTITWKSQGYEHTSSEVVGLLVNACVKLDTTIEATGTQYQGQPFGTLLHVTNTASETVKSMSIVFSGSGAQPSDATSVSVGDIAPGQTKTIPMNFTAPLVGRAKLLATISYVDDFGDVRSVSAQGWAKVQRTPPPAPKVEEPSLAQRLVAFAEAILGLNG